MTRDLTIRRATEEDVDTLVAFTLREAHEAEAADKDAEGVRAGVLAAFADPPAATYWVAESAAGDIVASISAVTEWSNFHGAHYWWIQSLYIRPESRGGGLVDALLDHVAEHAAAAGAVDLRLYVHTSNLRAIRAYERCRFETAPYAIMRRALGP